ncbi:outer membrane beta-barrel protein [Exilibacterium tricleocarpae]|uniref:Outer membrane beta-barrel protein n=1 Tax=Exilibacterium tricleocarpae TaxID=2591008 RepID=A0A545UA17_9GAMM|nr:OmpW family outer membrane protein [Exilibacterium tricleocarpae]TQV86253.1 outer membrane beta-barrel protein [Exilibacterium tricleocarpae]
MKAHLSKPGLVLAAALATAALPAGAYEPGEWILRAGATTVAPDESSSNVAIDGDTLSLDGGTSQLEVDDNTQLGLTATYMLDANWGIEVLAATPFTHTVSGAGELAGLDIAEVTHLPPTVSAVYHFSAVEGFTPYVGAGLNYTLFFSEDLTGSADTALSGLGLTGGDVEADSSFGFALQVGADYQLDDTWFINASIRWIDIDTTAKISFDNGSDIDADLEIDPLVYSVLVGRRF